MLPLKKKISCFLNTGISSISTEPPTAHAFLSESPPELTGSIGSWIFIICVVINTKDVNNSKNTTIRWERHSPKLSLLSGPASPTLNCETDKICHFPSIGT